MNTSTIGSTKIGMKMKLICVQDTESIKDGPKDIEKSVERLLGLLEDKAEKFLKIDNPSNHKKTLLEIVGIKFLNIKNNKGDEVIIAYGTAIIDEKI